MNSLGVQLDALVATMFDHPLRYQVESESRPHEKHLVELDRYPRRDDTKRFNGQCSCERFTFALQPLLARNILPEEALAAKLVDIKKWQRPEDALRCKHIVSAKLQHSDDMVEAIHSAKAAHAAKSRGRAAPAGAY